jgi:thiol:disulfide interchange protein/DsbC/DsbD-like thiol-disulfide interchange protein
MLGGSGIRDAISLSHYGADLENFPSPLIDDSVRGHETLGIHPQCLQRLIQSPVRAMHRTDTFSRIFNNLVLLMVLPFAAPLARAQMHDGVELVKADLIADTVAVAPGKPFTVGLRLKMAPHWHTYWEYSGDAGLATKIAWKLPPGFTAGELQWPIPETIVSPGDIINYGYSDEVVLLTEITPPPNLAPGTDVEIAGKASWLVCSDICVPGSGDLSLQLTTGNEVQPANGDTIDKYRGLIPKPFDAKEAGFGLRTSMQGKDVVWTLTGFHPKAAQIVEFFPLPPDPVQVGHPIVEGTANGGADVDIRQPITAGNTDAAKLTGVLAIRGAGLADVGWVISAGGDGSASAAPSTNPNGTGSAADVANAASAPPSGSLLYFLLIGFLGGLVLNVMPCVLPVISLKLFSFIKQANEEPARVWRMGVAYAAGVFTWFLGFAVLVVVLKSGGREIGNGFHLQNPWFVVGLAAMTFVFALNLLGVFEIILPGGVIGAADSAGRREGYAGAYIQGVLATVLGSACTAPFFGAALGFAFAQQGLVIIAMFAAIAAGMSAPFLLLAARPGWLRFMPKPGAWMERVKQGTGFLLLATVVWLLFILGHLRGPDAMTWASGLLLALGAACWVQGAFNTFTAKNGARWASRLAILALVGGGGWYCVTQISEAQLAEGGDGGAFAPRLAAALQTGKPVFVDFTAEWCVNCKVYEKAVLASDAVQKALRDRDAVFLKADWTAGAADITELLHHFGRAGVPLYVIYPAGKPEEPVVMPELITQGIVLDAFAEADRRAATLAQK